MWAVSFAAFAAQLLLTSPSRAWSWDEAIYLSQVTPGSPALPFVASRARGITAIVAPLSALGAPGWLIRVGLAAASSIVMALMFRLWVRPLGFGAPVGAFLFAASWPALLYGSEVMPNLWSALFGVGMTACLVRIAMAPNGGSRGSVAGLAVLAGLMAFVRPPDALVLALALAIVLLAADRDRWRSLPPMFLGVAAGWTPWIVEMSVRFGGPTDALRQARDVSHLGGHGSGVGQHLALVDGPLLGPIPSTGSRWPGCCGGGVLSILTLVAVILERRGNRAAAVRLAAAGGLALACAYVFLISGLAPRFLLPALALLSISTGCGVDALRRAGDPGRVAAAAVALCIVGWAVWQAGTLRRVEHVAATQRAETEAVGDSIAESSHRARAACVVASTDSYPQVAFAAGCRGQAFDGDPSAITDPPGTQGSVILVSRRTLGTIAGFREQPSPIDGWFVYRGT